MIKLTNILHEIDFVKFEKPYTISPPINSFVKPDEDDTMASWLYKNKISYNVNKYKLIQYRVNCSVNLLSVNFKMDYQKLLKLTKDKTYSEKDYNKFVLKPVVNEFQSYFNSICGENRVKVWSEVHGPIRLIIKVPSPEDFKMSPN